ncbi:MAG: thioredoxin family protein [Bacilli bacterium]|nr:thioredoxin family protein [Bacilli bacterium]
MKIIQIRAKWCVSCLIMEDRMAIIKKEYPSLVITNYDYDEDQVMVAKWQVGKVLPVIIILDEDNNEVMRLIGEKKINDLRQALNKGGKNDLL